MIQYRIPVTPIKISTNQIYSGIHWAKRKKIKDDIFNLTRISCREIKQIESYPVEIVYRYHFSSRALDTLNCAFMSKMFEDSLCSLGVIKDDTPTYVSRAVIEVFAEAKKTNNKEDWVEITINSI